MRQLSKHAGSSRGGFTLVELLVVMSLMLILATIAVLFVPRALEQEKASAGARMLVGWLQTARANALRDQAPRGVRLLPYTDQIGTLQGFQVRQLQYVQQPPDFVVQPGLYPNLPSRRLQVLVPPRSPPTALLEPPPPGFAMPVPGFTGGFIDPKDYPVQPGDYVEVCGGGLLYRIAALPPITNDTLTLVQHQPPLPPVAPMSSFTGDYRIIRAPRVSGEDPLEMPVDVGIDLSPKGQGYDLPAPLTGSPAVTGGPPWFDVLFAPSGAVVGDGAAFDKIVFWVRDLTQANATDNEPQLVCVYTRSGAIAVHPVDVSGGNFYTFTADGRSSD
jgi:prepilin-type N-terminal cleavage/methylation domain-containing protein